MCFSPATNFSVGIQPHCITSTDFNGDGFADLATANYNSNNISVLLSTGTSSFIPVSNFTVGSGPISVSSADFNGDGFGDIATANYGSNSVSVLLGTGTGSFGTAANFTVGSTPYSVTSADFNGDGLADIATANYGSGNISVLLNASTNTVTASFSSAINFNAGSGSISVISADFNGDGLADLAAANYGSNNVSILLNISTSTLTASFGSATNLTVGTNPFSLISADFNGDGLVDLATANNGSNNVSVLLNANTSTVTASFGDTINFVAGNLPNSIISADFDGDGLLDLATANDVSNNVSVLLNTGTSTLTASFGTPIPFNTSVNSQSIISADFNGDGKVDIAVANDGSDNVSVLLNGVPVVGITGTLIICAGSSTILSGTNAFTYTWSTSDTTSSIVVSPTVTTTYTLTEANGVCTATTVATVSVNATPTITISATSNTVCASNTTTLTASGANSYTWSTTETTTTISATPMVTTNYTVTGTDGNGCMNMDTLSIIVENCTTGIEQLANNQITIYPNPASNSFQVAFSGIESASIINVYDVNGKMVLSQNLNDKTIIDTGILNEGIYNISINANVGVVNKRLIIVK
jgi:VCBS repeat protein/type IX secretion system substrate protein/FG-GAP repeat protein